MGGDNTNEKIMVVQHNWLTSRPSTQGLWVLKYLILHILIHSYSSTVLVKHFMTNYILIGLYRRLIFFRLIGYMPL
ncbi:Os07g0508101 [Oryza sativa Japonica Group]|uniref:Os07g0508101 protein n=1 Tax=Oryza sativa subsp. japonica TaxID=39947 RepID=A0A0P0X6I9_ORYSJ|nr:Os07g0508101 [Oryza sativa Japonica Group]